MSSSDEKWIVSQVLKLYPNPVIVELGAHVGEEYQWLSLLKPSKYVMVEPDSKNCRTILQNLKLRITPIECAIGSINGRIPFFSSDNLESLNRASGSIRKPTGHLKHFPQVTFTPAQTQVITLDTLAKIEGLDHIDLLWCDIQGAERDMIEGGRATLRKTRYMMIEAEPEVELYEGQALKPELIAMLPEWEIIKDFQYNLFMKNTKFNAQPV